MMFKNSLKLLCSNFDKVWKLLLFHLLAMGFCFGLLAIFYGYYTDALVYAYNEAGLESVIQTGTLYGASFAHALTSIVNFVLIFFESIFSNVVLGLYFCLIAFYVFPLLVNIGKYATCEMLYGYMSACQKQSFTGALLKTLRSSLAYSSLKVLYAVPFNALIVLATWSLTRIESTFFVYLMPFILVLVVAGLLALKRVFNGGWAPAKVVYAQNIAKSYSIGMRASLRKGATIFSTAFVIYLLAIVLSLTLGLYAIIIIIPLVFPLIHIFDMVAFFSSQGMRFYVDSQTIISPKKLEEVDRIEDAKYLL